MTIDPPCFCHCSDTPVTCPRCRPQGNYIGGDRFLWSYSEVFRIGLDGVARNGFGEELPPGIDPLTAVASREVHSQPDKDEIE